jgi:ketosteroid isomerase-like protein
MSNRETESELVLDLDRLRIKALVDKDLATLDRIISDDYTHVESNGKARNKAEFLDSLRVGDYSFASFVIDENDVRIYGDTAVVAGRYHNDIRTPQGLQPTKYARHLRVYVRSGAGWRNVAHQATEMPASMEKS